MTTTWADLPEGTAFPATNLPYGVFSHDGEFPRVGVALGDDVMDLAPLAAAEGLDGGHVFEAPSLNPFLAMGRPSWSAVRSWLVELVTHEGYRDLVESHLVPQSEVTMHLPFDVADYVDFYSSQHHAENVGRIFRPDGEALTPNWKHLPIGYHGRAGTVVVSGTDVVRPSGQRKAPDDAAPTYGPSRRLDIEAEVGFVVGVPSPLGRAVPTRDFRQHIFGVCLVNDWSARDLQAWEYVPLGPFLGKSFATSVSPWVVPLDALGDARLPGPEQNPAVLPYLERHSDWALDLRLEVSWNGTVVARPPFSQMYWTPDQQLAHLTVNGAALRTGDLYASGTVSGPERDQRGSFLELSWNGQEQVALDDGSTRTFLEDGDTVAISAWAPGPDGTRIGFGAVTGTVIPGP
ncbi:MAG TPA: fumarylacetoacetase [Actinomycetes bacterium]|nr:fumarylacetoacetase [Actinomycetes bacterium]